MDRVARIISEVFDLDESSIDREMMPDDIESWDSLSQLLLITSLEDEFNIILEIEEIFTIMKFGDIYDLLSKKELI